MGGATCKHERTEVVKEDDKWTSKLLWETRIITVKCLDCPATFKKEETRGRLSGYCYSVKEVDRSQCDHCKYDIDESTCEKQSETTLGGSFLRLFMGPGMDGIQYHHFLLARAKCRRCDFKFYVRSEFEKQWQNQERVDVRTTKWIPITREKDGKTYYVKVEEKTTD